MEGCSVYFLFDLYLFSYIGWSVVWVCFRNRYLDIFLENNFVEVLTGVVVLLVVVLL